MTSQPIPKIEQGLLDRHARQRDEWKGAFADCESTDGAYVFNEQTRRAEPTKLGKKLEAKRDRIGKALETTAEKLRSRGYVLESFDSVPVKAAPADEPAPAEAPAEAAPAPAGGSEPAAPAAEPAPARFNTVAEFTDYLIAQAREQGLEADNVDLDALDRLGGELHRAGEVKTLRGRAFPNKAFVNDVKRGLKVEVVA
jgi:hypothetical protein